MKYETINNFLKEEDLKNIQNILFGKNFPWYYSSTVASDADCSDYFFFHMLFNNNHTQSDFFNTILIPIISNIKMKNLIRAKINCYTKKNKFIKTEMHIDQTYPHRVALFSINNNNGYTFFDNKNKFVSKENNILFFDGNLKHCSVGQTDENLRINININYL